MPETPAGFILAPTPTAIRRIVPRRFGTHFYMPMDQTGEAKDKAILTISREMPLDSKRLIHTSTVVSRAELENGGASLYERFVVHAIAALDNRVGKMVSA